MTIPQQNDAYRQIAVWLLICCAMIFAMVVLGGVTRLTGSGLSMVEWDPVFGFVPPLNQGEWEVVFEKYKASPEYQKINVGMDLDGFKGIYWFEFTHRVLGRGIGMVFLLPFLWFLIRRRIDRPLVPKLVTMFVLGGLQGLMGWYMVKSGLVDRPHVSQYRLTAHLALAFAIYAYILWVALDLLTGGRRDDGTAPGAVGLRRFLWTVTGLACITILSGGFVAGLKAGFAYNTFPLMGDRLIPGGMFYQEPLIRNFFENITTVQFNHRVLAVTTFLGICALWWAARRPALSGATRVGFHVLLLAGVIQVALGISTLLMHVPIPLAAAHQAGALLVLTVLVYLNHRMVGSRR